MTVDLRFFDSTTNQEISIDKTTGGHDFGVCKKNSPYVYPVVIKNLGDTDATGISLKATPLNASNEVSTDEYTAQQLAATWQQFSLFPDQDFATTLTLPNIAAGTTLLGKNKIYDDFSNPQNSSWSTDTRTGHKYIWTGSSMQMIPDPITSTTATYGRIDATKYGSNKEIDLTTTFSMPNTVTTGSAFTMWGFRMNCLGDEKGYLVNMKKSYNATTGTSTVFFEIRKGAGWKSTNTTDFGTTLATSQSVSWVDGNTPVRIKVFTNTNNLPEIKLWVGNVKDTDTTLTWGSTNPTNSWVDTSNTYALAGGVSMILGMSSGMNSTWVHEIKNTKFITNDINGKIYIKTAVGDGAVDQQVYKSAIEFSYD